MWQVLRGFVSDSEFLFVFTTLCAWMTRLFDYLKKNIHRGEECICSPSLRDGPFDFWGCVCKWFFKPFHGLGICFFLATCILVMCSFFGSLNVRGFFRQCARAWFFLVQVCIASRICFFQNHPYTSYSQMVHPYCFFYCHYCFSWWELVIWYYWRKDCESSSLILSESNKDILNFKLVLSIFIAVV